MCDVVAQAKNWSSKVKKISIKSRIPVNFEIYSLERDSTGDREFVFFSIFYFYINFFRILYFFKMAEKNSTKNYEQCFAVNLWITYQK